MGKIYSYRSDLYEYVKANRGVGHTRLLMDGAINAQYPFFLVGADMSHANHLAQQIGNRFAVPISIQDTNRLMGSDTPLLIDNYVFTKTCEGFIRTIRDQREEIERLTKENNKAIDIIKELPIWYRLFKKVFKKKINKILG